MGASVITQAYYNLGNIRKVTFDCTANSATGTFTSVALTQKIEGRLLQLVTNPGSPAPDANYDITLLNQHSVDMLISCGLNRHTSTSEIANIVFDVDSSAHPVVTDADTLTLAIAGTTVKSAKTVIELYYGLGV